MSLTEQTSSLGKRLKLAWGIATGSRAVGKRTIDTIEPRGADGMHCTR